MLNIIIVRELLSGIVLEPDAAESAVLMYFWVAADISLMLIFILGVFLPMSWPIEVSVYSCQGLFQVI